tara:strand:+ start:13127 stop:13531 length:405 start_codon:yes stop_codon:yes gene_type:complete
MNPIVLQQYRQAVITAIQATVQEIFTKSQENCPVVTGNLRNSGSITSANPEEADYTISYNINDSAPYVQLVEEGGYVNSYNRRNPRTGTVHAVQGYPVEGRFFIKQAIEDVFSGQYNLLITNANIGSQGYYVNI